MYRYYGIIRAFTGGALASQSVYVYDDAAGTSLADLFDSSGSGIANPTTTNSRGAIDIYSPRGALWYKVAGDTAVQPLPRMGVGGVINVKDYGALGDGVTDDTAAFNAAIEAALAYATYSGSGSAYSRPIIYVPSGKYVVGALTPITAGGGVTIRGDGKWATELRLKSGETGPIFAQGAYTATPSSWWSTGSATDGANVTYEGFNIIDPDGDNYPSAGSRDSTAFADYGCGTVMMRDVLVRGFQYGFLGAWGSDYDTFSDVEFYRCDVCIYLGPHSQQVTIDRCWFTAGVEHIVLDSAGHVVITNCVFNNPMTRDVTFESNSTNRMGVTVSGSGGPTPYGYILIENCWYETGNAWSDVYKDMWDPHELIYITSDVAATYPYHRFVVRGGYIVDGYNETYQAARARDSNGYPEVMYAFLRVHSGTNIRIEDLVAHGAHINAWVALDENCHDASDIQIRNVSTLYGGYHRAKTYGLTSATQDYRRYTGAKTAAFLTADNSWNNTTTPLTVTHAGHGLAVADILQVENEFMYVSDVSGDQFTVQRGTNSVSGLSSAIAAHADGVQVYRYRGSGTTIIGPMEYFWVGNGPGHASPGTHLLQHSYSNSNARYGLRVRNDMTQQATQDPAGSGPWELRNNTYGTMMELRNPYMNYRTRLRSNTPQNFYLEASSNAGESWNVAPIRLFQAGNSVQWGSAAPTSGTYVRGDIVWNTGAVAGGKVGWVCVASGSPGTWKAFGVIDS